MDVKGMTPILNVSNLAESFAWFEKLGWKKLWDWEFAVHSRLSRGWTHVSYQRRVERTPVINNNIHHSQEVSHG